MVNTMKYILTALAVLLPGIAMAQPGPAVPGCVAPGCTAAAGTFGTLSASGAAFASGRLTVLNGLSSLRTPPDSISPSVSIAMADTNGEAMLFFGTDYGAGWNSYGYFGVQGSFANIALYLGNASTGTGVALERSGSNLYVGGSDTGTAQHTGILFKHSGSMTIPGAINASGVLTLSSAGTALSVTNNATIGGTLTATAPISTGTKFTVSGCAADTTAGGAAAGTFVSRTTGVCTVVITINGATGATAPTGWSCWVNNLTTANLIRQTAATTTTASVSGTTVTGDTISFGCMGF